MSDLRDLVAAYRAEHPGTSGSEIARAIRRQKAAVLGVCNDLDREVNVDPASALEQRGNRFPARAVAAFGVEGAVWTDTSLELPLDVSFDDYQHVCWALGQVRKMANFGIGDAVNLGEARFGERYAQALEATGLAPQTLINYTYVCRKVAPSRRRADLSFRHHAEVAALEPEQQIEWFEAAARNQWSAAELRAWLRPEPALPPAVEVVPSAADEEALISGYRLLQRQYGRVPPGRLLRLAEKRLQRIDREQEAERIKALALISGQIVRESLVIGDGIELRQGDFRVALADLPDASVDLVFTDPPYHAEFLPLWTDVAVLAARALKPGRLLVTYSGNLYADEAISRLSEHLDFVTVGAVELPGAHSRIQPLGMHVGSKPLLFFSAGRYERRGSFSNFARHAAPEKNSHPLAAVPQRRYVSVFTKPEEIGLDPLLGAGTAGVAAVGLGRRFIGCDIDDTSVATAAERITAARAAPEPGAAS